MPTPLLTINNNRHQSKTPLIVVSALCIVLFCNLHTLPSTTAAENRRFAVVLDVHGVLSVPYNGSTLATYERFLIDGTTTMRQDANTLCNDYADKGYFIQYYSSRPATLVMEKTTRELTEEWLTAQGFPMGAGIASLKLSLQPPPYDDNPQILASVWNDYWINNEYIALCRIFDSLERDGKQVLYVYGSSIAAINASLDCAHIHAHQIVFQADREDSLLDADTKGSIIHVEKDYTAWRTTYVAAAPYTADITPEAVSSGEEGDPVKRKGPNYQLISIALALMCTVLLALVSLLVWRRYHYKLGGRGGSHGVLYGRTRRRGSLMDEEDYPLIGTGKPLNRSLYNIIYK